MNDGDDLIDYNEVDPEDLIAVSNLDAPNQGKRGSTEDPAALSTMNRNHSFRPNSVMKHTTSRSIQSHPVGRLTISNIGSE